VEVTRRGYVLSRASPAGTQLKLRPTNRAGRLRGATRRAELTRRG